MKALLKLAAAGAVLVPFPANANESQRPPTGWAAEAGLTALCAERRPVRTSEIESRLQIQDLFARYAMALDDGNAAVMQSLFTDDAVSTVRFWNGYSPGKSVGGQQIAQQFQVLLRRQMDQRRHIISNIIVRDLSADSADVTASAIVTRTANDATSLAGSVVYSAIAKRGSDGLWRFSQLIIGIDSTDTASGDRE